MNLKFEASLIYIINSRLAKLCNNKQENIGEGLLVGSWPPS